MNIVFLDIDGVIQPYNAVSRFYFSEKDAKKTLKNLEMEELKKYYPDNTVITKNYISISDMNECIKILKKTK